MDIYDTLRATSNIQYLTPINLALKPRVQTLALHLACNIESDMAQWITPILMEGCKAGSRTQTVTL